MTKKISGLIERPREQAKAEKADRAKARRERLQELRNGQGGGAVGQTLGRAGRWAGIAVLSLLALAAALVGLLIGAPQIFAPLNDYQAEGEIAAPGLAAPLAIRRDANGTPYIFAETWRDALYGQGFAVAQDRLFQMEGARLLAAGRLSEFAGGGFLPQDRMARTLGFRRLAEARLAALDEPSRNELEAFAAGMNAFISERPEDAPLEMRLLGQRAPRPWSPVDLLSIVYLQSWWFSSSQLDAELLGQAILERFEGDEATAEAFYPFVANPDEPGSGERRDQSRAETSRPYEDLDLDPGAPLWGWAHDGPAGSRRAALDKPTALAAAGSNNWAFSGARMGRKPALVANDPHLDIRRLPGPWHPAGLFTADGIRAVGANVGLPGLFLGRNGSIAFGLTVGYADVVDLAVETVDPARPGFYLEGEGEAARWVAAERRVERILVAVERGHETVLFDVLETPRGPILPDFGLVGRKDRALSLRWSAASAEMAARPHYSMEPLLRAGSAAEGAAALEGLAEASLNFVVGDIEGEVLRRSTGFVPDRAEGDGLTPLPAARAAGAWAGFLTGAALPGEISPPEGWVGSANHLLAEEDFGRPYASMVSPAWRYRRMKALFDGEAPLDPRLARQAQRDVLNGLGVALTPMIAAALEDDPERRVETAAAFEILSNWDRRDEADSAGPLVFQEILRRMAWRLYEPSLGPALAREMLGKREFWQERFAHALPKAAGPIFERAGVDGAIGRDVMIRLAAVDAMTTLEALHGSDPKRWRWGDALKVRFSGPVPAPEDLGAAAAPLGARKVEIQGSPEALDRAHFLFFRPDPESPLEEVDNAASLRMIADLADDEKVMATLAGGVVGRTLHPHLADQVDDWARYGRTRYWWFSEAKIREHAVSELRLVPKD